MSGAQTFSHHIKELRRRLFLSVAVLLVVGSVVYYYRDFFIDFIMSPLGNQKLIYLTPAGGFAFIFTATTFVTILIALPFLIYQIYSFIKPAMPGHTRKLSVSIAIFAFILMLVGSTFGYVVAAPAGLKFLSNFASNYVDAAITAESYLNFVIGYVLGIGALFELPLVLLFVHWIHPLTPKGLLRSERFVLLGAFVVAAVISPSPDVLNQTIIAVPIIIIYQLGVIAVFVSIRRNKKKIVLSNKGMSSVSNHVEPRSKERIYAPRMTHKSPHTASRIVQNKKPLDANRLHVQSPVSRPMRAMDIMGPPNAARRYPQRAASGSVSTVNKSGRSSTVNQLTMRGNRKNQDIRKTSPRVISDFTIRRNKKY